MSLRCWKYLYLVWNLFFFFSSSFYGGKFIFWFICMHSKVLILNDLCFSCLQKSVPCHKSIEILFCIFLLKVLKFCLSHYTCNWFFFYGVRWGSVFIFFFGYSSHVCWPAGKQSHVGETKPGQAGTQGSSSELWEERYMSSKVVLMSWLWKHLPTTHKSRRFDQARGGP